MKALQKVEQSFRKSQIFIVTYEFSKVYEDWWKSLTYFHNSISEKLQNENHQNINEIFINLSCSSLHSTNVKSKSKPGKGFELEKLCIENTKLISCKIYFHWEGTQPLLGFMVDWLPISFPPKQVTRVSFSAPG